MLCLSICFVYHAMLRAVRCPQAAISYQNIAAKLLEGVATSFGLPADSFESITDLPKGEVPASRLEAIKYTVPQTKTHSHVSCKEHVDRGLFTLIHYDIGPRLQVGQYHHHLSIMPATIAACKLLQVHMLMLRLLLPGSNT